MVLFQKFASQTVDSEFTNIQPSKDFPLYFILSILSVITTSIDVLP